jgi:1-acyl-sn-glycerol-3-phosphate acyltransferase
MTLTRSIVCWFIRGFTDLACRIDHAELAKLPSNGPYILASNHIGSLEVPLLYAHLQPRRMFGLAKIETWDNKFMGWLFNIFEAIPIRRGEADLDAIRKSIEVLKEGNFLVVAPEGTRSRHGRLIRAQPGVVVLAVRSGAPILPMVHWGSEEFGEKVKKFRRTDFRVQVGRPFTIDTRGEKMSGELRQKIVDEIMFQLAVLMPPEYRGEYSNLEMASQKYIQFI